MADNSIFTTIAEGIEKGKTLPIIVKDKDGNINKEETSRINANNSLFNTVQNNAGFTLGKLSNAIIKFIATKEQRRVIDAAKKAPELKKANMAKGGMYKKKMHSYAAGGMVKDMKIMRNK